LTTIENDYSRFNLRVFPEPSCGCWLWAGASDGHGYGHFWFRKAIMKAHRVSWIFHHGEIPSGLWVLHHCDNPACVNPAHLFLGDRTANMRDMAAKGRQVFQVSPEKVARGSRAGQSKLNEEQVLKIKQALSNGNSLRNISLEYGVNKSTISHIRTGRNWSHLI
jgi:hypothetical protein